MDHKEAPESNEGNGQTDPPADKQSELVTNASQQRNWRGIVIALLVIIIVCALIVTAVVIATPSEDSDNMGEKFTFQDYLESPSYKPRSFTANWIEGKNAFLYENDYGQIHLFNCSTNTSELLVDNSTLGDLDAEVTQISADGKHLLLKYNANKEYRHSTLADYSTYDLTTHNMRRVIPPQFINNSGEIIPLAIQYLAFAPVGDAMVLVQNNNIYYMSHVDSAPEQLSNNGNAAICNGIPDWVYEEEVFGKDNAVWWSPEATYLIYATFNDTQVEVFQFPVYGDMSNSYTAIKKIFYPKAGLVNPTFTLNIVHLESKSKATLTPPPELADRDYLFTSVVWRNDKEVLITWMNRIQNRAVVTLCDADGGRCKKSLDIKSTTGWLEPLNHPVFMPDGSHYFWVLPKREDSYGTFKHVAMVEIRKGVLNDRKSFLTKGRWEVTAIKGYNPVNKTLYFTSPMDDARHSHLYSVTVDTKDVKCETCSYDPVNCLYNTVSMAPTSDFYILGCEGPGVPTYSLMDNDRTEIQLMENNTYFKTIIAKKAMPQVVYEQVELDDGTKLWAKLLLPPQLKREEILKYPLVLFVYGGPGTQQVQMKYTIDWQTYMVSSRDIIYAFVDGRGTKGRGDKFLHAMYRNMGGVEVDDTIKAANYFAKLHYVDAKKMALWGWSYGGYLTASVLGREKKPFKCGISVAPVTDWKYYDSIYTERYMRLPTSSDNLEGYRRANVSQYARNFRGTSFMLVHGTKDDNVHFQHAAQLVKALTEANVYFRFQMYTDMTHMLMGGNTRRHMYESIEDFLVECFEGYSEKFGWVPPPKSDEEEISE